jgi:hypothetical protein
VSVTPVLCHKLYGPPDQLTVGALVHEGEQATAIKGGKQTVLAGVTMRQENVLCFEYGLLGNINCGCDFHRIMTLQGGAMSVINAMNNASHYTEFPGWTAVNPPKLFVDRRRCYETAPLHLYELTLRDTGFATITYTLQFICRRR